MFGSLRAIIEAQSPPPGALALIAAFALAVVAARLFAYLFLRGRPVSIQARIRGLERGNAVLLDVGSAASVRHGQVFTVYKRLAMIELDGISDGTLRRTGGQYSPVGQAKVISTTPTTALCKYRALPGLSSAPSVGDVCYYTSTAPAEQVVPLPVED